MDIDKILQKFGVFSGLSGDALTACPTAKTPWPS